MKQGSDSQYRMEIKEKPGNRHKKKGGTETTYGSQDLCNKG